MTERELLELIEKSAESVEIPESIAPEAIKKKLDNMLENQALFKEFKEAENLGAEESHKTEEEKKTGNLTEGKEVSIGEKLRTGGRKMNKYTRRCMAAAAVLLVCGVGVFAASQGDLWNNISRDGKYTEAVKDMAAAEGASGGASDAEASDMAASDMEAERSEEIVIAQAEPKRDAGELYVVAESYGEVYDVLYENSSYNRYMQNSSAVLDGAMVEEDIEYSESVVDLGATSGTGDAVAGAPTQSESVAKEESAASDDTSNGNYSKTNIQTEGVDESDIIKTDGSYIYAVDGSCIHIADVKGETMKEAGKIDVAMNSASDRIEEMYVAGDTLNLIVTKEESELKKQSNNEWHSNLGGSSGTAYVVEDVLYFDSNMVTELLTYDISNPEKPELKGTMVQEGYYKTSRKIGDVVYLFTEKYLEVPNMIRSYAIEEDQVGGWLPLVNGAAVAYDCIYVPQQGNNSLLVTSVDVKKPDQVVDNIMIVNDSVDIYVSTEALYLYGWNYEDGDAFTEIAKFSLKKGAINAVGATTARGEVYDTFAINEYQGKLRLLTTDWSNGEDENNLYLFDEDLKLTGKLTGIAPGERIYSARYFKDMAYFVTYRNTDPLFAVDLSDENNPKILSELKITGFSEYLHFWGENKLLGIGYETDPDTGIQEGLKLTMFDISNPAELTVAGTCVIENVDYSPALYNYKCVLADAEENVIGFMAESYQRLESDYNYLLFKWEDGKFKELMTESLDGTVWMEQYRGIYIDDTFYLANPKKIISYDREDGYRMREKLEF